MKRGPNDDSQRKKIRSDSQEISAATESTENQSLFANIKNANSSWLFTQVEQPSAQNVSDILIEDAETVEIKAWITKVKRDYPHHPLLNIAARHGREDVVRFLLGLPEDQRPDVNAISWMQTPLHEAAFRGYTGIVRLLLKLPEGQRPDVNVRDEQQKTPLHWAALSGEIDIVRFLLALPDGQRPDVNARDDGGRTPLHWAAEKGHTGIVRFLLGLPEGQRPDVNARDNYGVTPLHLAAREDHTDIVCLLLALPVGQRPDVNARDDKGWTPLHWAAYKGRTDIVRLLLELPEVQRRDVNAINNEGSTPLHLAARKGHTDIVRFLLNLPEGQRPDVNARDNRGLSPLHLAVASGHTEIARLLLELPEGQHPDVNARTNDDWTPLHLAAFNGRTDIVRLLLELPDDQRPDVNARDNGGSTPLMRAFEQGKHEIVTLLQQHGAELPDYLRPDAPPGAAAAAAINDRQSIHTTSIHESVSSSATALLKRYEAEDIHAARESLFAWVNAQSGDTSNILDKTEAAKRCIGNYGAIDFTDPRSEVTLSQAFGLVWLGINDANAIEDKTLTHEDINSRRQTLLIDHLYRMQRGYNLNDKEQDNGKPDKPICTAGSFSTLINTLARAHKEVTFIFVNAASVSLKAEAVLKSYIKSLTPEEKTTFAKEDYSEDEILPQTLFNKLKEHLQAQLEVAFGDCKGLLANYDKVVTEFLNHLEFHPKIAELSSELIKLRQANGTVSEIEIDLSPSPGYFPSVNDEAEEQASAPAHPVMTSTFTPISARRMGR